MAQQNYNRKAFAVRKELRKDSPFAARYIAPEDRDARKRAKIMREIEQTPVFIALLCVLETIDRDVRRGMIERLALSATVNPTVRQAVEIIRSTLLTVGQQMDLSRALDHLRAEDGQ